MVSGMHVGDVGTYTFDDITDWIVFTEEDRKNIFHINNRYANKFGIAVVFLYVLLTLVS